MAFERFVLKTEEVAKGDGFWWLRVGKRVILNNMTRKWDTDTLMTLLEWSAKKVGLKVKDGKTVVKVSTRGECFDGYANQCIPSFEYIVRRPGLRNADAIADKVFPKGSEPKIGLGVVSLILPDLRHAKWLWTDFAYDKMVKSFDNLTHYNVASLLFLVLHELTHVRDYRINDLAEASSYWGYGKGLGSRRVRHIDRPCEVEANHVAGRVLFRNVDEIKSMSDRLFGDEKVR